MTTLASIVREAQQALESYEPVELDLVEQARNAFGAEAWQEAHRWRETGRLPESIRGLELLGIEVKLDQEI